MYGHGWRLPEEAAGRGGGIECWGGAGGGTIGTASAAAAAAVRTVIESVTACEVSALLRKDVKHRVEEVLIAADIPGGRLQPWP